MEESHNRIGVLDMPTHHLDQDAGTAGAALRLRVTAVRWKSENVRTIELRSTEKTALPSFEAGAHLDLHLPNGLVRSYSLVSNPTDRGRYVVAVARDRASRGGSTFIHDQLRVGDVLRVAAPRNLFPLDRGSASALLIGGGIGITPLMTMAAELERRDRDWTLYYAVRTADEAAFSVDLARYGHRVRIHCDDEAGVILPIAAVVDAAPEGAHFYCCGPAPMLDAFVGATRAFPPALVHLERFTATEQAATAGGFLVELVRAKRTIAVPGGSTILEALTNQGINWPNSCQQGICGTCEARVLDGVPDHRDSVLTDSEHAANQSMMICCSGSRSEKLVLDI